MLFHLPKVTKLPNPYRYTDKGQVVVEKCSNMMVYMNINI